MDAVRQGVGIEDAVVVAHGESEASACECHTKGHGDGRWPRELALDGIAAEPAGRAYLPSVSTAPRPRTPRPRAMEPGGTHSLEAGSQHYHTVDPIDNLVLRVVVRYVRDATVADKADSFVVRQAVEAQAKAQPAKGEKSLWMRDFQWQEKELSPQCVGRLRLQNAAVPACSRRRRRPRFAVIWPCSRGR